MSDTAEIVSFGQLTKNTLSVGMGRWVAQVLNVLFVPLALAYISPADFGLFSLVQIAALIGGVIMSFGFNAAFIARLSHEARNPESLVGRIAGQQAIFGGAMLVLLWIASGPVAQWLMNTEPPLLLRIALIGEFFANFTLIFNRWQIFTDRHWQLSIAALAASVADILLLVILVIWRRYGLLGLLVADAGSKIVGLVTTWIVSRGVWKLEFRASDTPRMLASGLPAAPDPIFFWLLIFIPLYFLKQNGLLALAGAMSLGWRLLSPVDLLGNSLASGAAGKLVDPKARRADLAAWHRLSIFSLALAALLILGFSPEILHLFFGTKYLALMQLLPLMATGVLFLAFYYFEWIGLTGSGRTYGLSLASGGGVVTTLLFATVFLHGQVNGTSVGWMFALGFFVMWLIARFMTRGRHFGNWFALVSTALITGFVGSLLVRTGSSIGWTTAKALVFIIAALPVGIWQLDQVIRARTASDGSASGFLSIPNYAEVARRIGRVPTLLDVGCSEGFFLGELPTGGLKVGLDTDFARLKRGRADRAEICFVCADASRLPFRREAFDAVVMIGVLPYVEQPAIVLGEAHRVLKCFGQIEISAASREGGYYRMNIYRLRGSIRFFTGSELDALLAMTGFRLKGVYSRGKLLTTLISNLFPLANHLDRLLGNSDSVLGPWGRWARRITNPMIRWEYGHHHGAGYQLFASGIRNE